MSPAPAIVETSFARFFRVRPTGDSADHVWLGVEQKRVKGGFVDKAKAREILVRKVGCKLVQGVL